jgi:diguanylate cyclase (GGDEF)-like protein
VAAALGVTIIVSGRRRRADRRSDGAVTLVENLLGAVHDPDAMLGVVLQSAVAVTGAAGGSLSWRGETVHHGARADGREALDIELFDDEGVAVGQLALVAGQEPFGRDTTTLVGTVVERGIAALEAVRRQRIVQYQAVTDELTGLANRRRLRTVLELEVARADRSATPLSVIVADLDNFKQINDAHGHGAGDGVLHAFAGVLGERIRTTDVAARLGGDEFVVVLPDTPLEGAVALAENLRRALLDDVEYEALRGVTASFGAAGHATGGTAETLLHAADEALYAAKRAGRNRVVAAAAVE